MDDFRHPDFMRNHDSSSCTGRKKWYTVFHLGRASEHRQLPACPTRIRVSSIRVRPDTTPMGKTTAPERGARPNGHQRCRLWDATIIDIYGPMFGLNITKEDTPEIYKLLQDVSCTTDSITVRAKRQHMRLRPYVYYKEGTLIPEKEEKHAGEGSWPSGHTSLGWTTALLLIDINPAATDGIMARAYEHGQSRVIAGYHRQTDVDAARLAASLLYIKLQGNERFQQQMAKARQEFKEKTSGQTRINAPNTQSTATGQSLVYTLSGQPATSETRGIVIVDHKKVLKH